MHTRFSTRGHQRVAYDIDGPDDGPVVVLLHDLLGQRSSLASIRRGLGDSARTIAVDLRGHGASATISGASIDLRDLALDVSAVLEQERIASAVLGQERVASAVLGQGRAASVVLGQERVASAVLGQERVASAVLGQERAASVVLVGHGLGAAVARLLAAESPSLVSAVVAIEPPTVGLDGEPLAESDRRAADLAYKGLPDAALAAYLGPRLGPTWRDDLPRPTVAALRRHAPALATLIPALAATTAVRVLDPTIPTTSIHADAGRLDPSPATVTAILAAVTLPLR